MDRILEGDSEIESVGRVEMSETRKSAAIFIGNAKLKNGLDLLCYIGCTQQHNNKRTVTVHCTFINSLPATK